MDRKTALEPEREAELPPPSYNESITNAFPPSSTKSPTSNPNPSSTSTSTSTVNTIHTELANLARNLSTIQTQRDILTSSKDEKVLGLMTPCIREYLSAFGQTPYSSGTLILIPRLYSEDNTEFTPCIFDSKTPIPTSSPSTFLRFVQFPTVSQAQNKYEDEKETYYWQDPAQARRLARSLNPPPPQLKENDTLPPPVTLPLPSRPVSTVDGTANTNTNTTSNFKFFWKRKGSHRISNPPSPSPTKAEEKRETQSFIGSGEKQQRDGDADGLGGVRGVGSDENEGVKVLMEVTAEEMLFRTENEMGLYGTETGWAVVFRLRVVGGVR